MKPRNATTADAQAADSLVKVVEIVRLANPDKQQILRDGYWLWISEYPDAEPLFDAAVRSVVKRNPTMLSETETSRSLMINVVARAIARDLSESELRDKCLETSGSVGIASVDCLEGQSHRMDTV